MNEFLVASGRALANLDRSEIHTAIDAAADLVARALTANGTVFFCGNGGSAAEANHMAAELTGRLVNDRRPLAGISLCADQSAITAIGNDYGFEQIFARQLSGLGRAGDVVFCLSTSGRSPNVLAAAIAAKERGIAVVALVGSEAGPLGAHSDVVIACPGENTGVIQVCHLAVAHEVLGRAEERLAPLAS